MDSIKDHKGKPSSLRILMYLLFVEATIVTICVLIMFFIAILTYSPEFCTPLLGLLGTAGIPLVSTLIIKLKQSKIELNGNKEDIDEPEK